MSKWGNFPWENDIAADWLIDYNQSNGTDFWHKEMQKMKNQLNQNEFLISYEICCIGVWLFKQIGIHGVWQSDDYDKDLQTAIDVADDTLQYLDKTLGAKIVVNDSYYTNLKNDLEVLRKRQQNPSYSSPINTVINGLTGRVSNSLSYQNLSNTMKFEEQ